MPDPSGNGTKNPVDKPGTVDYKWRKLPTPQPDSEQLYNMKHRIVLMLVIFLGLTSLTSADRYIDWSLKRPLLWSDFQGRPKYSQDSLHGAVTDAFLDRKFYQKNLGITYVKAVFDKQSSWVTVPDSLSLIHEQGHFDIVEIYARKFNNEFNDEKIQAKENVLALQDKRFNEIGTELAKTQAKYDKEINKDYFDREQQTKWNKWIKKQLDSIPKIEFQ